MDLSVFYEVVVPLLEMALAVLICISTPVDTFNFYSLMFDMMNPDTGENVFITYALDLICDMCKPRPDAEKCTHKLKYIPPWKDVAKLNTVSLMFGDRISTLKRESRGVVTDEGGTLILPAYIKELQDRAPWVPELSLLPREIIMTVDPNAGGSNQMAIWSAVYVAGQMVVVGMDSHSVATPEQAHMLLGSHIVALRHHKWLETTPILFMCECNTGMAADYFVDYILKKKHYINIYPVKRESGKEGRYGIWTTADAKERYARSIREYLSTGGVFYMQGMVCANPFLEPSKRLETTRGEFEKQAARARPVGLEPKTPHGKARMGFSAKVGKDGKIVQGFNDDLFFTAAMNGQMYREYCTHEIPTIDYAFIAHMRQGRR